MCWSGEASTALAVAGLATTAYAAYKKEPPVLWVCLLYFSLMEALQAYTYTVINQCDSPGNQIATLFGYLHIAFQPFFINAVSMFFIPASIRRKIYIPVYMACFASAIFMIIQLYPFEWAGKCDSSRPLCGEHMCSVSGNWHIAWEVPTNGICNDLSINNVPVFHHGFPSYVFVGFVLPLLYGSWRFTIYHYFMGPLLAWELTNNMNEWPAVWCLLSIALLMIVVKTPLRRLLFVKNWLLWPKKHRGQKNSDASD